MNHSSFLKFALLLVLIFPLAMSTNSQCAKIAKSHVSELSPYVFSGQVNSVKLVAGQMANLAGPLLGGQEYKIIIAGTEGYGPFIFRIRDNNNKIIFDNDAHENAQSWIFKVGVTEIYTIELGIPIQKDGDQKKKTNEAVCVGILVGFIPAK
jgi:hypothetical protein